MWASRRARTDAATSSASPAACVARAGPSDRSLATSAVRPGRSSGGGRGGPPPGAPPPIDCAGEGQACVADWISGPHCCKTGAPLLCNWGVKCEACVPHGEECRMGGPELCGNAKDGDYCVLDPTIDKVICDIPDAPDKK